MMKAWSDGGFGHPIPFVTIDVDQWSLRFETGMAMVFSTLMGQGK